MSSSSDKTYNSNIRCEIVKIIVTVVVKDEIIRVGTYHVLPIPKPVQVASLREHRARCRPFLVKYTKTVLDSQPIHYKRTSTHYD